MVHIIQLSYFFKQVIDTHTLISDILYCFYEIVTYISYILVL